MLAAFSAGDPEQVYRVTQKLLQRNRELLSLSAKLRFELNFNSDLCQNCDGMKAGPGVVATCYQVRLCNFTNVREVPADSRKLRVLQGLFEAEVPVPKKNP